MVWGTRAGIDDILERVRASNGSKSLYVLSTRKISEEDAVKLAQAISSNSWLEELYLSGHQLGDKGLQAFADCLKRNRSLRHICIGNDTFGDEGVKVISQGIAGNPDSALEVWDLEYKSVSENGAIAIANILTKNESLKELSLSRNAIGDEGVEALMVALSESPKAVLTRLRLDECALSGKAIDAMARWIKSPHCTLQILDLANNDLKSASAEFFHALRANTSIQKINFRNCHLADSHGTELGNALALNKGLQELDLSENNLGPNAAAAIATAFATNESLHSLVMAKNPVSDEGAIALATVLASSNSTLLSLDLSKTELTHLGVAKLLSSTALKELRVFNNLLGAKVSSVLDPLMKNPVIELLDVGANALHGSLAVLLFDALHSHPSLRTLEMGGNDLGEEGHDALERLREANPYLDVAIDKNAQNDNSQ